MTQTTEPAATAVTDRQATFIVKLLGEREGYSEGFAERVKVGLSTFVMTKTEASNVISWLLTQPKKADPQVKPEIPAGYYAVKSATGNNDLDFYVIDAPTEGKWAGYMFVKRVIGGRPVQRVRNPEATDVLARILAAGVEASAVLYGTEIGRCYVCNRTLTDELSRDLGIGPHCRAGAVDR